MPQGYVRFPSIYQDQIVFVSEDDLWSISTTGGRAERLTAGVGEVSYPQFSPDGKLLAFVGREEGPSEVYVMPSQGGIAQRLTFEGASCHVLGWSLKGDKILYSSNSSQFTGRHEVIFAISPDGGQPEQVPVGMANAISYGPEGGIVIGRNINEPSRWKRYRGGTAGHLWCDPEGSGTFKRLLTLNGNIAGPCWIGSRIYFISDHEGIGNVYSSTPHGEDVRKHTNHEDFYVRNLSTDKHRLVYHAGTELYLFNPETNEEQKLVVELPSSRTQRSRKFVNAAQYIDTFALHPQGHALAITSRGKAFSMGNWEGPVVQHGEPDGVRYRFLNWLNDGKRLVAINDAGGKENLIVFNPDAPTETRTYPELEFGRVTNLKVSPTDDKIALANHRQELLVIDLVSGASRLIERSDHDRISGIAWSPNGQWLAYGFAFTAQKKAIKLCNLESGETHFATEPVLHDISPSFDPDGKYLYFLGYRSFNPVYDNLHFDLGFPKGIQPFAIMLRRDLRSPFILEPKAPNDKDKDEKKPASDENGGESSKEGEASNGNGNGQTSAFTIDLEGITMRAVPFPVPEGRYSQILGIKGKALYSNYPVEGTIPVPGEQYEPHGTLYSYDFEAHKQEQVAEGISGFALSRDNKTLIYRSQRRLRVFKASDKSPKEGGDRPGRESGWINLNRIKVSVQPSSEWKQMFAEAWRLQREQFWSEDMSGINWQQIYDRYEPLVERVSSRAELSDLLWELQGELGTSHAYEHGGEYRHGPHYRQGRLGVDWSYDAGSNRYRITGIIKGDPWNSNATSPLNTPGLNIEVGDAVIAVNGQLVSATRSPHELLVNQAGNEVQLTIERAQSQEVTNVTVKAISNAVEEAARYRDWIEHNRQVVHERSNGKVGYIFVPDMVGTGYAEFHRGFLTEYDYPALLVDVRWNRGGHVSGLLLEKLARRRIGYDIPRWGQPRPYPDESARGPMVALTNELAGSDGDIFSHSFKLMGLGPLIGKRTWGGVIGIHPRHALVDGTVTTQPEFAFWFKDVGWNVENYGTDPDIDVDIAPQDYVNKQDPQLERAIAEALRLVEEIPSLEPGERPRHTTAGD